MIEGLRNLRENRKRKNALRQELKTFKKNKALLLKLVPEQFVLVKGKEIICAREDMREAIKEGYSLYGNQPFLVKQVLEVEPVHIIPSPRLIRRDPTE